MGQVLLEGDASSSSKKNPAPSESGAPSDAGKGRPPTHDSPGGVVPSRTRLLSRLNAWRKHTPLNPYWTDFYWLQRSMLTLAPHAAGRLLDVGVGERPHGKVFGPRVSRYIGLEYPPMADNLSPGIWTMLERVRGIIDVWGDGGALPFQDQSFDTLLALEVLEHVPEPDKLVREFVRVLKPGGRLLVTVPFAAPMHQLPFDYQRFTEVGIRTLIERQGLVVELLEPRGNFAAVVGSIRAHYFLRLFGASKKLHDGSVTMSRWRAPFVLPCIALIQIVYYWIAAMSKDTTYSLGYSVVARKV